MKKIHLFLILVFIIASCKKTVLTDQPEPGQAAESMVKKGGSASSIVTTTSVIAGSAIQATLNGTVSSGGSSITERGFCYGTATGPTIAGDTARAGSGTGNFQRTVTGLTAGTTYYVRAYCIKNGTVNYGNELSVTTLTLGMPGPGIGTVYDIDGNAYTTVTLGTQVWMVENLKTTHYRDGSAIENKTEGAFWGIYATGSTPAYCDYENNPGNAAIYGRLYNVLAMKDPRGIAPAGWHVPNYTEWTTLLNYLGGTGVAGGRMKETGLAHWLTPNTAADNSSGFTALGAGERAWNTAGAFSNQHTRTTFWSSNSSYLGTTNVVYLSYNSASYSMSLGSISGAENFGWSIRCIKD